MWAGRLAARLHLELRAAKLLDLERVDVPITVGTARELEGDPAPTQVRPFGQLEGDIEAAMVVGTELATAELVAERAIGLIGDQSPAGEELQIAIPAPIEIPHPALQVQSLTGAIHAAII